MSNDCPGMLPEQKVYITVQTNKVYVTVLFLLKLMNSLLVSISIVLVNSFRTWYVEPCSNIRSNLQPC